MLKSGELWDFWVNYIWTWSQGGSMTLFLQPPDWDMVGYFDLLFDMPGVIPMWVLGKEKHSKLGGLAQWGAHKWFNQESCNSLGDKAAGWIIDDINQRILGAGKDSILWKNIFTLSCKLLSIELLGVDPMSDAWRLPHGITD